MVNGRSLLYPPGAQLAPGDPTGNNSMPGNQLTVAQVRCLTCGSSWLERAAVAGCCPQAPGRQAAVPSPVKQHIPKPAWTQGQAPAYLLKYLTLGSPCTLSETQKHLSLASHVVRDGVPQCRSSSFGRGQERAHFPEGSGPGMKRADPAPHPQPEAVTEHFLLPRPIKCFLP